MSEQLKNIDDIDDVDVLRELLRETTERLQTAAEMGLNIALQNKELQSKLETVTSEQEEMKHKIGLIERERRWMQEQSLVVDQVREAVGELQARTSGYRNTRNTVDARVDAVQDGLSTLRSDVDGILQILEDINAQRLAAAAERLRNRSSMKDEDIQDGFASANERMDEIQKDIKQLESRVKGKHIETARSFGELSSNIDDIALTQDGIQQNMNILATKQDELSESFQSIVQEYNVMLNTHEHALMQLNSDVQSSIYNTNGLASPGSVVDMALTTPVISRHGSSLSTNIHNGAVHHLPTPVSNKRTPRHTSSPQSATMRSIGESIGDIFAKDAALLSTEDSSSNSSSNNDKGLLTTIDDVIQEKADGLFSASSASFGAESTSKTRQQQVRTISDYVKLHANSTPVRKAASTIGVTRNNNSNNSNNTHVSMPDGNTKSATVSSRKRPDGLRRTLSFVTLNSRDAATSESPIVKYAAPTSPFDTIISTSTHVGVGWGNYWQARRHRIQFDIQKQLTMIATPALAGAVKQESNVAGDSDNDDDQFGIED